MKMLTYSELIRIPSYEERYEYLKLDGRVGDRTFGSSRYLNQALYHSEEWKALKHRLIVRDNGCDLAFPGYDIFDRICLHHLNPITKEDILNRNPKVLDPENLICTSYNTHKAIHYGDRDLLNLLVERRPGDTTPWEIR